MNLFAGPRFAAFAATLLITASAAAAEPTHVGDTPWIVDLNAGVPKLSSGNFAVAADATLGYSAPALGSIGHGDLAYYDSDNAAALSETLKEGGTLEGWWLGGAADDSFRFEIRANGGAHLYSSTYTPRVATAGFFHDEDSLLGHGAFLIGLRAHSDRVRFALNLGGGAQYETYDYLTTDPADPNLLSSTDTFSARGEGRLRFRWIAAPDLLSLRVRGDGTYFRLTRSSLFVGQTGGVALTETEVRSTEVSARLFIDADVAAFFGITPALFGGVDYFSLSADAGSVSTTVPIAGIGLVKVDPF